MQARDEFLAARAKGIGGTDIAAILGVSRYKSAVDVWLEKTGRVIRDPNESTLPQRFGLFAEEFNAQEYTRKTGRKVVRFTRQLIHPEHNFIRGNIDRLVIPEGAKVAAHHGEIRTNRGMEAKCVSAYAGGEWGDDDSDDVPVFYLAQCAWYQMLTGCEFWDLSALIGNGRFEVYEFRRDLDLEQMLVARAVEFWNNHVLADLPPPPLSERDVLSLYPRNVEGKRAIATPEVAAVVMARKLAKEEAKKIEARLAGYELEIKQFLTDAEALYLDAEGGDKLLSWKNNKDSRQTDFEAALSELLLRLPEEERGSVRAELVAKYSTVKAGARVLRFA